MNMGANPMRAPVTLSTTFSLDDIGRYVCNTLDEAMASQDSGIHPDARPFDLIVVGGGSFGGVAAAHLFDIDASHRHRVLVLEAGPLALPEHVQTLPPDLNPPGKGGAGTVWGQPWLSDSPMSFNRNFPGLAFCIGGRSVFWGGWSPYLRNRARCILRGHDRLVADSHDDIHLGPRPG
jgi:hypothetical protein